MNKYEYKRKEWIEISENPLKIGCEWIRMNRND